MRVMVRGRWCRAAVRAYQSARGAITAGKVEEEASDNEDKSRGDGEDAQDDVGVRQIVIVFGIGIGVRIGVRDWDWSARELGWAALPLDRRDVQAGAQ